MKKSFTQKHFNNQGFTIIETLTGLSIAAIAFTALVTGLLSIKKLEEGSQVRWSEQRQIIQIAENIRASIENYQVHFVTSLEDPKVAALLDVKNLPMAWTSNEVMPASSCPSCPGKYGFIVTPNPKPFTGLYTITIRMTHKTWPEPFREYQFVVSSK